MYLWLTYRSKLFLPEWSFYGTRSLPGSHIRNRGSQNVEKHRKQRRAAAKPAACHTTLVALQQQWQPSRDQSMRNNPCTYRGFHIGAMHTASAKCHRFFLEQLNLAKCVHLLTTRHVRLIMHAILAAHIPLYHQDTLYCRAPLCKVWSMQRNSLTICRVVSCV